MAKQFTICVSNYETNYMTKFIERQHYEYMTDEYIVD